MRWALYSLFMAKEQWFETVQKKIVERRDSKASPISIRLTKEVNEKLSSYCRSNKVSKADLIDLVLSEYFKQVKARGG